MFRCILSSLVALALTVSASAQFRIDDAPLNGWYDAGGGWIKLYDDGKFVGWLEPTTGKWQTAGKNHVVDLVQAFALAPAAAPTGDNFGMDWHPDGKEVISLNGKKIDRNAMVEAITANGDAKDIPLDDKTPRLLMLSRSAETRQAFLRDAEANPKWKGKVIFAARDPDDWSVKWPGGKVLYPMGEFDPTMYATDGDGTRRGVASAYAGPQDIDTFVAAAQRLRDAPAADPSKAPDLRSPAANGKSGTEPAEPAITAEDGGYGCALALMAAVPALVIRRRLMQHNQAQNNQ